jgi:hypothetical protein
MEGIDLSVHAGLKRLKRNLAGSGGLHSYVSSTRSQYLGRRPQVLVCNHSILRRQKETPVMTNFKLLVAAAISLLAAAPAVAMPHHHHRYAYSRAYRAYGFYRGGDNYASSNFLGDFDRRNTFN